MKTCTRCGGPLPYLQHPLMAALGVFGPALTPDGPGRNVSELAKHVAHCAEVWSICTKCSGVFYQPAWLPLSPVVERIEALAASARR